MVKIIFKLLTIIALTLTLAISNTAFALTKLTSSIDANPVMSNESIVLTVTADDSVERSALDTTPLTNDFIVARTEVSSQTSMVNFKTTRTTRWQIVLIPRKTGKLIIPALQIENNYSKAIAVNVVEQGSAESTKQQDIFISAELSVNDVYVQQLVTLTVKLHIGVQLQRGSLTEPTLPGATIVQIGKDQESDGIINGKRYRIIERTYAITPEQSGELTLTSPMFSGEVMVQSRRRSGFLSFGETKPVNILGEKLSLNVRPIPESYSSNASWLPSELLTLHQEWQPNDKEFKVGEPITRTITLTAAGLTKSQLPKITMTAPAGLKVYPDQAELHSSLSKERLVSQKKQNFALVASQAGQYLLPKITIAWWNTVTNKYQQAVLPEQTITVLPNGDTNKQFPIVNKINEDENIIASAPQTAPIAANPLPIIIKESSKLQWLFLALWILTLLAWLTHVIYLKRNTKINTNIDKKLPVNNHYRALMAACKQNSAEQALNLIVPWINSLTPQLPISTLSEALLLVNNSAFTQAIDNVQQHLYSKDANTDVWQGKGLLSAIQDINADKFEIVKNSEIKLNPS
mgnify:CR=1 FL=1